VGVGWVGGRRGNVIRSVWKSPRGGASLWGRTTAPNGAGAGGDASRRGWTRAASLARAAFGEKSPATGGNPPEPGRSGPPNDRIEAGRAARCCPPPRLGDRSHLSKEIAQAGQGYCRPAPVGGKSSTTYENRPRWVSSRANDRTEGSPARVDAPPAARRARWCGGTSPTTRARPTRETGGRGRPAANRTAATPTPTARTSDAAGCRTTSRAPAPTSPGWPRSAPASTRRPPAGTSAGRRR
jgi:hypothetical protein